MLNSFNLFLSLLSFWAVLMIASGHISWLYAACGIFAAIFVVLISVRLKLIQKNSEMLYLSVGFHRHFIKLFFKNFFSSLILLFKLAFKERFVAPTSYKITEIDPKINISAFISTINMSCGLLVTKLTKKTISIHSAEESCFKRFDSKRFQNILLQINDDNLV